MERKSINLILTVQLDIWKYYVTYTQLYHINAMKCTKYANRAIDNKAKRETKSGTTNWPQRMPYPNSELFRVFFRLDFR